MTHIRNFVIIAHIDAGKSTLADRLLEVTGTVPARRMRPQYLDQLELERERGITIKMAPVRMRYRLTTNDQQLTTEGRKSSIVSRESSDSEYILNLIDTPGHSDFSYEVSRALAAVEGAVLLVDATKGIQAQTLSNFRAAQRAGLTIVGAVNKIDLNPPGAERIASLLADLLQKPRGEIAMISGKTGAGVAGLLERVIREVPPPTSAARDPRLRGRALVFDSLYDDHKGILGYVRVFDGAFTAGDEVVLGARGARFRIKEVGHFLPELAVAQELATGEMGYVATGLKESALVQIGDTIVSGQMSDVKGQMSKWALPGYREPSPVVFISFYPDGKTKFEDLKRAFERLRLTDAALQFEPDSNEALGRGLKAGFLGQLHFEIASSRLEREFNLQFLTSFPSIAYRVREGAAWRVVKDAHEFPDDPDEVRQPMIRVEILAPAEHVSQIMGLANVFDLSVGEVKNLGENVILKGEMPLAELIRDFDDQLKSVSQGFASFNYEPSGEAPTEVEKLEILIAGEVVPALTRVVFRKDAEREGRATVERLKELLPRLQFVQAVQARVRGRIIARETIPALRKDVTGYLYGGDRSRKMKLWKKQKRGKEKLRELARVRLSAEVFREILKK